MTKTKLRINIVGHLIYPLDSKLLISWDSEIIDINNTINEYKLPANSDGLNWEFTDELLEEYITKNFDDDFLVAIVNVPLEGNYYTRRLSNNRVVISTFQTYEILRAANIPIENFILHRIYVYSILYKKYSRIPDYSVSNSHDETRGCLFDMNPYKEELIHSSSKPIVCEDCYIKQSHEGVPTDYLKQVRKELKRIRKSTFYIISDFVKQYPILTISISVFFGILLNIFSNWLYDLLTIFNK